MHVPGPCLSCLTSDCDGRIVEPRHENQVQDIPDSTVDFSQVEHEAGRVGDIPDSRSCQQSSQGEEGAISIAHLVRPRSCSIISSSAEEWNGKMAKASRGKVRAAHRYRGSTRSFDLQSGVFIVRTWGVRSYVWIDTVERSCCISDHSISEI